MVSVVASSVVESKSGQTKDYNIGMCFFSTRHAVCKGERTNAGWLGIMIMCPSGANCLLADCCFNELAL